MSSQTQWPDNVGTIKDRICLKSELKTEQRKGSLQRNEVDELEEMKHRQINTGLMIQLTKAYNNSSEQRNTEKHFYRDKSDMLIMHAVILKIKIKVVNC